MNENEKEVGGINAVQIMEDIRAALPTQEEDWRTLRFEDIPVDTTESLEQNESAPFDQTDFDLNVGGALASWQIAFFRPLPDRGIKKLFKRVVRKLIRFCLEPVTQDCTEFNGSVARSLGLLRRYMRERAAVERRYENEIARLRRRTAELEERLAALESRNA